MFTDNSGFMESNSQPGTAVVTTLLMLMNMFSLFSADLKWSSWKFSQVYFRKRKYLESIFHVTTASTSCTTVPNVFVIRYTERILCVNTSELI